MPVFLDGQQNLATLTVPGVYGDIILPQPFLLGLPTNVEGLVGVASWGPLNSQIPVSKPSDAALSIGPPVVRNYDMSSYISAASQVGGSIGFTCIRVSDGTDTFANTAVQTGAAAATGTITINDNTLGTNTIVVNGVTVTWGTTVLVGATAAATTQNLLTFLQSSANGSLTVMTYALQVVGGITVPNTIVCTAVTPGTGGNSFTLNNGTSTTHVTMSGANLSGGVASGATCMTITGKYSGTLGNKIQFSIQNGTAANTYMGVVVFPGMVPEQFNNVAGPTVASGTLSMIAVPSNNDTIGIAGTTITFVNALTTGLQVLIGSSVAATMANLMTLLLGVTAATQPAGLTASQYSAASTDVNLPKATYSLNAAQNVLTVTANQVVSTGAYAGVSSKSWISWKNP